MMGSLIDRLAAMAAYQHDDLSIAQEAIERIRLLESALVECGRQADQCRIWGGMGWIYRLPQAEAIARKVREVLDAKGTQR